MFNIVVAVATENGEVHGHGHGHYTEISGREWCSAL